ncbi:MAG: 50S ribosomal protein L10, partial [Candidatus Rokuibacteriota bacterium]
MPTAEKAESIEALRQRLGGATAAVLTEYRGLTVQQLSELRKQLRAASAEYRVVKNRLARVAVEGS